MKFSKLFLTAFGMVIALTLSAQPADTTEKQTVTTVDKGGYDKGYHIMPEVKIGSCYGSAGWGANLALEHEFHKYLAWDIVSVDFSVPFVIDRYNIGLKTGLRAFTNRFRGDKVRGYTSVAAGWDCMVITDPGQRTGRKAKGLSNSKHGVGVSWGIGLQIQKHIFVGYTLEYSSALKNTSHYGKFGYRF
jgi:hypothetical protein